MPSSLAARHFALLLLGAGLILSGCDRNSDSNSNDVIAGQSARDGSLDASTMDALTGAQEPAMDVTAAIAAEEKAKANSTPATAAQNP